MTAETASLVLRRHRQIVQAAIVAALDSDGSTEFMPDVTPDQAATWIIDGPLSDPHITALLPLAPLLDEERTFRAHVTEAGGGTVLLLVDRDTDQYPTVGSHVTVTGQDTTESSA